MRSQPTPIRTSATPSLRLRRGREYDPFIHAEHLGLQILYRAIERSEVVLPREYKTIVLHSDVRPGMQRVALAHGIAHWDLGHPDDSPKNENAAHRYSSIYLIDPAEFDEVLVWTDDEAKIAQELGVTPRVLGAFLDLHRLA